MIHSTCGRSLQLRSETRDIESFVVQSTPLRSLEKTKRNDGICLYMAVKIGYKFKLTYIEFTDSFSYHYHYVRPSCSILENENWISTLNRCQTTG